MNPKEKTEDKHKIMTDKVRDKVHPSDMGVGIKVIIQTKTGGVFLECPDDDLDIKAVQSKIQTELGDSYNVTEKHLQRNRIKILGVDKMEENNTDEVIIKGIINQNKLDANRSEIKLVFRTKIRNGRFNIIIEVNEYVFSALINRDRVYLGWSSCKFLQDFGIVRCYNCSQFGHVSKYCRNETACPICSGNHSMSECEKIMKKCVNCYGANEKLIEF